MTKNMLHKFTCNGLDFEIGVPDGMTPEQAQHQHLISVSSSYRWLSFRRSLIAAPEYPLAVALALTNPALGVADGKMGQAIDACLNQGAEPEEVAAFQSALALYLSQLPNNADGQAIATRIQTLCADHQIPTN